MNVQILSDSIAELLVKRISEERLETRQNETRSYRNIGD